MSKYPYIDPSSYGWHESTSPSSSISCWRRRALANECMWIERPREQREMFVYGTLTLQVEGADVDVAQLSAAVRSAWRVLRHGAPELAVSARRDVAGRAWMCYSAPRDGEVEVEVEAWVDRTACVESRGPEDEEGRIRFEDLRARILGMKGRRDEDEDSVFLFVLGVVGEGRESSSIGRLAFVLNFDHRITDGIGARILAGRWLSLLSVALSDPDALEDPVDWEKSGKNLSPPWIEVMNEHQVISGPGYEEAVETNRKFIFEQMPTNPGLPLTIDPEPGPARQRTHFITLTTQSTHLTRAVKTLITPQSTITHLGHAALLIALLRSHPPPPGTDTLFSPCWLNGRRYLESSGEGYIPVCISFEPLIFTGLGNLALDLDLAKAGKHGIKEVLVRACRMVSMEYGKIREERRSVLPGNVAWMEEVGREMWERTKEKKESSPHVTAEGCASSSGDEGGDEGVRKTADPFFLSDGITERYIDHSYPSSASSSTLGTQEIKANKIFEVDDIQFSAHAEKNLIVRMSSWRGRTTISGEWVSCNFEEGVVVGFLEDFVEIMLSILDVE